jgi:hypothetical protein
MRGAFHPIVRTHMQYNRTTYLQDVSFRNMAGENLDQKVCYRKDEKELCYLEIFLQTIFIELNSPIMMKTYDLPGSISAPKLKNFNTIRKRN